MFSCDVESYLTQSVRGPTVENICVSFGSTLFGGLVEFTTLLWPSLADLTFDPVTSSTVSRGSRSVHSRDIKVISRLTHGLTDACVTT